MPVASCVATGTACGRHSVASLLSMPVASCVATGTACGRHSVASLLSMREGFPQKLPLHQPAFPACVPKRGSGFFLLRPSSHRGAISESPSAAALSRYGRLSCLRHALRAWVRRLPAAHPATAIASSTGPGYHALPTPGPPAATHATGPLPEDGTAIRNQINALGRDGADRLAPARPWSPGTAMLREKERHASKRSFFPLSSRKEAP